MFLQERHVRKLPIRPQTDEAPDLREECFLFCFFRDRCTVQHRFCRAPVEGLLSGFGDGCGQFLQRVPPEFVDDRDRNVDVLIQVDGDVVFRR